MIIIDDFIEASLSIAVHCKTKELLTKFLNLLKEREDFKCEELDTMPAEELAEYAFEAYKGDTCITNHSSGEYGKVTFGSLQTVKEYYEVVEAEDVIPTNVSKWFD